MYANILQSSGALTHAFPKHAGTWAQLTRVQQPSQAGARRGQHLREEGQLCWGTHARGALSLRPSGGTDQDTSGRA